MAPARIAQRTAEISARSSDRDARAYLFRATTSEVVFPGYLRVAGMTGTAREVGRELWSVYRLPVVTIPTHRPARRRIRKSWHTR